ncbi:hypothetical protein PMAN_a2324 [Pseudoalteromonas marina]|nr:hypothetical protein PMAN_a2324 [Pseudoalteromonas marina]
MWGISLILKNKKISKNSHFLVYLTQAMIKVFTIQSSGYFANASIKLSGYETPLV